MDFLKEITEKNIRIEKEIEEEGIKPKKSNKNFYLVNISGINRDEYYFSFEECEILLESKNVFKVLIKYRETIWPKEDLNDIMSTFSDHNNDYYACVYANPNEFEEIEDELMKQLIKK